MSPQASRTTSQRPNHNRSNPRRRPSTRPTSTARTGNGPGKPLVITPPLLGEIAADNAFVGRTGSGKTLAFALPLVATLAADPQPAAPGRPRALVLVPTRELATQVAAVIEPLAAAVNLRVTTVFGGVGHGPQRSAFAQGVEIVVACPGRLLDHMQAKDVSLDRIEITVLDEADHMADQGFLPIVRKILDATRINLRRSRAGMETLSKMFIDRKLYKIKKNETSIKMLIFQVSVIVILGVALVFLLLWGVLSLVG